MSACQKCGGPGELGVEARTMLAMFGQILRSRHEPALEASEVAMCPACYADHRGTLYADVERERADMRSICRRLERGEDVPSYEMRPALAGPFGHTVRIVLEGLGRMTNKKDPRKDIDA